MGSEVPQSSPTTHAAGVSRHCRSYAHNHQLGADGVGDTIAQDRHYTPAELSKTWHLSPNTIRRLFSDEPGVLKITADHRREEKYADAFWFSYAFRHESQCVFMHA
jgi:hypothetical protein